MKRLLPIVVVSAALAGCTLFRGKDEREGQAELKPSPLPAVTDSVKVKKLWSRDIGGGGKKSIRLSPATDGLAIYAATPEGRVTALDTQTGRELWSVRVKTEITGGVGFGEGLTIVGTIDGRVLALNAKDGNEVWSRELSSEVLAKPAVGSGRAVVRAVDGRVFGLATTNGDQVWTFRRPVPSLSLRGDSAPWLTRDVAILGFASGKVLAADLETGQVMWDITVAPPRGRNEVERMVDIEGRPMVLGGVLYVASYQGKLLALSLRQRRILWARDISTYNDIEVDANNVYLTDEEGNVLAVDRLTGTLLWRQVQLARRRLSGPTALGEYVMVGDFEGYLHVLSKSDGTVLGRARFGGDPIHAAPITAEDKTYVFTHGGTLAAITIE